MIYNKFKAILLTAVVSATLAISAAHAESTLLVGEHVVIKTIDGQSVSTGLLSAPTQKFTLPAGAHTVSATYRRLYDISSDDHDVLRSVELAVPVNMQDGRTYKVEMLNQPEDYDEAVEYAQKPTLAITSGGRVVAQKTAITSNSVGLVGSIGRMLTGSNTVQVQTNAPTTAVGVQRPSANEPTLDQFMRVWLNATPAERVKIKNWVKDQ